MSKNLTSVWGHNKPRNKYSESPHWVLPKELIGVEFEYEGVLIRSIAAEEYNTYYTAVDDGSLRDEGKEFVFTTPLFGADLVDALNEMGVMANKHNFRTTYRTSVHVHLDVRDLSAQEIHKLCVLYTLFERSLFAFIGDNREANNFCIPWYRSNTYFNTISLLKTSPDPGRAMNEAIGGMQRYSALNLVSMREHGSLEFRHMGGTLDMNRVKTWINMIMSLKKACKTLQFDDYNILAHLSTVGPEALVRSVFGNLLDDYWTPAAIWDGVLETQNLLVHSEQLSFISPIEKYLSQTKPGKLASNFVKVTVNGSANHQFATLDTENE